MNRQQMEMSFDSAVAFRPSARRARRQTRARWWFEQMRQVVERTGDLPAPEALPGDSRGRLSQKPERN
jgi:hypothetical protein